MKKLLLLFILSPFAALCQINTLPPGAVAKPAFSWFLQGTGSTSRAIGYSGGYYYPWLTVQDGANFVPYTGATTDFTTKHKVSFESTVTGLTTHSFVDPGDGGFLWLIDQITGDVTEFQGNRIYDFNNGSRIPYLKQGEAISYTDTLNKIATKYELAHGSFPFWKLTGTSNLTGAATINTGTSNELLIGETTNNTAIVDIDPLHKRVNIISGDPVAGSGSHLILNPGSLGLDAQSTYTQDITLSTLTRNAITVFNDALYGMAYAQHPNYSKPIFGGLQLMDQIGVDSTAIAKADSVKNTATFSSIAAMQAYTGSSNRASVTDSLRGGVFNYVASGLIADNGVVFTRTSSGYWKRQYDVSKGVNVSWWGTSTASWNTAIKYAGAGGTINAVPKYVYPQTDEIIPLLNQTINGNGATLQRQHEASVLNTAIVNSTDMTITVASIPSTWKVGDFLQIWVTQSSVGCTLRNKITNITGNVVTLQYAVGTGQYNSQTSWAIGTAHVRKVFHQITNPINPSVATNGETLTGTWTINNMTFDGQSSINSENVYWGVNNAIFAQGINQQITGCTFLNMPNDNIGGHGLIGHDNYYNTGNNSFFHASADYLVSPLQVPYDFYDNIILNSNQILSSTGSQHSEGAFTLSFTSGYGSIHNNWCKGGLDAVIGNIAWSTDVKSGATRYFDFYHNQCFNYSGIIAGFSTGTGGLINPGTIKIIGNTFSNCGTTAPFPALNTNVGPFIWEANQTPDGTTVTVPMWAHNTGDNIINSTGGLAQQTGAINISGTIASGAITSTGAVGATSVVSSGGVSGTTGTFTSDVTLNSGSTATYGINYLMGGLGQAGSSIATFKAKNTSRGNTVGSLASSTSLFLQGPGTPDNITTIRPEVSMYRGSNANPEAVFREHTTANTGFELAVGNGSVVPVTVAEGVYNTTSTFRIPSGVNFNLAGLTASSPVFTDASKNLTNTGTVPIANGGTGSATQNFVDLTTAQTVAGNKSLTGFTSIGGAYKSTAGWLTLNNGGTTSTRNWITFASHTNASDNAYIGSATGTADGSSNALVDDIIIRVNLGNKLIITNTTTPALTVNNANQLQLNQYGLGVVHSSSTGLLSSSLIVNSDITNGTITPGKADTTASGFQPKAGVVTTASPYFWPLTGTRTVTGDVLIANYAHNIAIGDNAHQYAIIQQHLSDSVTSSNSIASYGPAWNAALTTTPRGATLGFIRQIDNAVVQFRMNRNRAEVPDGRVVLYNTLNHTPLYYSGIDTTTMSDDSTVVSSKWVKGRIKSAISAFPLLSANNTWAGSNAFNGGIGVGSGHGLQIYNTANTFFSLLNPSGGFTANQNLYIPDATGTIALTSQLPIHGNSTTTGTATTAVTVSIGTTMANTTYNVSITPRDLLTAVNYYISAQTTTTFTVTFVTGLTGSINFDYLVTP